MARLKNDLSEHAKIAEKLVDILLKNNAKIETKNRQEESPFTLAFNYRLTDLALKMCNVQQTITLDNKLVKLLEKEAMIPQFIKLNSFLRLRSQYEHKNELPILDRQSPQDENEFRRAALGQAYIESHIQRTWVIKKDVPKQIEISPSVQIFPERPYSLYSYLTDMIFPVFNRYGRDFYTFFKDRYSEHINNSYIISWSRVASSRFFKIYNSYCTAQERKLEEKDRSELLRWIQTSLFEVNLNETTLVLVGKSAKEMTERKERVNEDAVYQMMKNIQLQQVVLDGLVYKIIYQLEMDLRVKTGLEFQHGIIGLHLHLVKVLAHIEFHEAMKDILCDQLIKIIQIMIEQKKTANDFQKSKNKISSLFMIKLADFKDVSNPVYYTLFFQRAMLEKLLSSVRPLEKEKNKRKGHSSENARIKKQRAETIIAEENNDAMESTETALDKNDESNQTGTATTVSSSNSSLFPNQSLAMRSKRKAEDQSDNSLEKGNKISKHSS